ESQHANQVVYTGTHDNDTTVGWYASLDKDTHARVRQHFSGGEPKMPDALIDAAYASPARLAVVPLQDLLGSGSDARMNRPGSADGNWRWRFPWREIGPDIAIDARRRAERSGRLPEAGPSAA